MAMNNFVANGQAYWYWPPKDDEPVRLKLGSYEGNDDKKQLRAIAQFRKSPNYPFEKNRRVFLTICGKEFEVTYMTDLDLYIEIQERYGTQLLW